MPIGIFQRFMRLVVPFYFGQLSEKAGEMVMSYLCEVSESISKKGGIDYSVIERAVDNKDADKEQLNNS